MQRLPLMFPANHYWRRRIEALGDSRRACNRVCGRGVATVTARPVSRLARNLKI
jgi:hypothetical protein